MNFNYLKKYSTNQLEKKLSSKDLTKNQIEGIKEILNFRKKKRILGNVVTFLPFRSKESVEGKVVRIFKERDGKMYCRIISENKKEYHKQLSKVTLK